MKALSIIRLAFPLYEAVKADLMRPHPFAHERVGFLFTRSGKGVQDVSMLFPVDYLSLPDEQYVDEKNLQIGAAIDGAAIRSAMQRVMDTGLGALHVHMHGYHQGKPHFSSTDWHDFPDIVRSFQNANPHLIHGALLLSQDMATGALWFPSQDLHEPQYPRVSIVGSPMRICPEVYYER